MATQLQHIQQLEQIELEAKKIADTLTVLKDLDKEIYSIIQLQLKEAKEVNNEQLLDTKVLAETIYLHILEKAKVVKPEKSLKQKVEDDVNSTILKRRISKR